MLHVSREIFFGCEKSVKLIKAVCEAFGPVTNVYAYKTGAPELDLVVFEGPNIPDNLTPFYREHAPKEMQDLEMGDCCLESAKICPSLCAPENSVMEYLKEV